MPGPKKTFKVKTKDNNPKYLYFVDDLATLDESNSTELEDVDDDGKWRIKDEPAKYLRKSADSDQITVGAQPNESWQFVTAGTRSYVQLGSDKWAYDSSGNVWLGTRSQRTELVEEPAQE